MARKSRTLDLTNENQSPIKIIIALAWPLFLEQILSTLVSFADTAMVGALGVTATAAVSITNSVVFLINGVVIAMGVGLTAYVSRSVGARDYEAAKAYIRHAFLILAMVGLPLCIAMTILHRQIPAWMGGEEIIMDHASNYVLITSILRIFSMAMLLLGSVFRGRGDTKTPLRINILVNIINVVGNYILINPRHTIRIFGLSIPMFGAGLGVEGAALSTGFSWVIGGIIMAVMLFTKDEPTRISAKESFRPNSMLIKRVLNLSLPAMFERFSMSVSSIIVTKSIASLGTTVVAANTVYGTAESISYMPAFAFATAVTTLVGQSLGARKPRLAERYTWYTVAIGGILLSLAGVGLYVFAEPMVRLFTPDESAIAIAKKCLKIVAFIQPVQTTAWIFAGALRGAGDTKWPMYITAGCTWGIRALGAFLCIRVFHMGLPEAVICMCIDISFRCVFMYLRFRTGKWKTAIKDRPAVKAV